MAYAVINKQLAEATSTKDAFVGRININKKDDLRLFEEDFVIIRWDKWLEIKEGKEVTAW